jgi:hypothetical protein
VFFVTERDISKFGFVRNEQMPAQKAGGLYKNKNGFVEAGPDSSDRALGFLLRGNFSCTITHWSFSQERKKAWRVRESRHAFF